MEREAVHDGNSSEEGWRIHFLENGKFVNDIFKLVPDIEIIDTDLFINNVSKETFKNLTNLRKIKRLIINEQEESIKEDIFDDNPNIEEFLGIRADFNTYDNAKIPEEALDKLTKLDKSKYKWVERYIPQE